MDSSEKDLKRIFASLTRRAEDALEATFVKVKMDLSTQEVLPEFLLAIVAMGKFGGRELTYGSDLDLIVIFETAKAQLLKTQETLARLVQKMITRLGTATDAEYAYKVDMDLRPSGRSGVLVSSFESFQEYHQTMAQLWEQQALVKARPVVGPPEFCHRITDSIHSIVYRERPATIGQEIDRLRQRMEREIGREILQPHNSRYDIKVGYGGLVDIEFLVQYLQLCHGWDHPELRTTQTLAALEACIPLYLSPDEAKKLAEAYFLYRKLETRLRQATGSQTSVIREGSRVMAEIEDLHFSHLQGKLMDNFRETREDVRRIYHKILGVHGNH